MVRVAGVNLPQNKHLVVALRNIYGIGKTNSFYVCREAGVPPSLKVSELSDNKIFKIQNMVKRLEIEGDLRRRISMNIKRLKDIKSYRGNRHKLGLPVRGQKTKNNAKTRKKSKSKSRKM